MNLLSNNITNWKICEFGKLVIKPTEKLDPKTHAEFRCVELEHIEQDVGWINGYANSNNLSSVKNKFYVGDTLFGKLRPYLKKYWHAEFDGGCSSEIWVLRANQSLMDSKYLFYFVQSNRFIQATNVTSGSKMPRADWSFVSNLPFPVPSLPEQQKIVEILSTWDQAIKTTQKLIDQLKLRNKGLAQQLLTGKKRLKGFEGEWEELRADKIFKSHTDKSHNGELEVLSATQERGVIPRSLNNIDIKFDEGSLGNYKKVEIGDYVISLRSFQGGIEYSEYEGIVSPAYTVLKEIAQISKTFYKIYFKTETFISRLNTIIYGIRDGKQINYKDFSTLKLPYPPVDEQKAISVVLEQADKELNLHQQQLDALKEQKKGLMQRLLTGEIRVKID